MRAESAGQSMRAVAEEGRLRYQTRKGYPDKKNGMATGKEASMAGDDGTGRVLSLALESGRIATG
jgi:hypothetical protein